MQFVFASNVSFKKIWKIFQEGASSNVHVNQFERTECPLTGTCIVGGGAV